MRDNVTKGTCNVRRSNGRSHDRLKFADGSFQFAEQRVGFLALKFIQQCAVVPEGAVAFAAKSFPDPVAYLAIGGDDGADVVEFVGSGYQARVAISRSQMRDVCFLAFEPRRFGFKIGICAAVHYVSDATAEAAADFAKHGRATAVLDDVVQERSDGKVFIASRFEHKVGNTQQMRNVRDGCSLAVLARMFLCRKNKCPFKAWAQSCDSLPFGFHRAVGSLHIVNQDDVAVDFAARQE